MITMNQTGLTDSILRMRSCLSRVELAASRLGRDAGTPVARELADDISDAVAEIDDEIAQSLLVLRVEAGSPGESGDASEILNDLRRRMLPVLKAHEIEWAEPTVEPAWETGDRVGFELATLVMIRSGIEMVGQGGRMELTAIGDPNRARVGIYLRARCVAAFDHDEKGLARARRLAERHGGALDLDESEDGTAVTLWLDSQGRS